MRSDGRSLALLIECFVISTELIFATYTTFPPCINKSTAVTRELGEGGTNAKNAYLQAVILPC